MKKYDINIETVTVNKNDKITMKSTLTVTVLSNDRNSAILAGLNTVQDIRDGTYFRITEIIEKNY